MSARTMLYSSARYRRRQTTDDGACTWCTGTVRMLLALILTAAGLLALMRASTQDTGRRLIRPLLVMDDTESHTPTRLRETEGIESPAAASGDPREVLVENASTAWETRPSSSRGAVAGCPKGDYMDASRRKRAEAALADHFERYES